ncbi:MAG TPA: DUF3422 domain-containing protein [Rhodospirillales bacterium]|jgi:uncharacterized membrane-anchored protein
MAAFKEHSLRQTLAEELHARPHGVVDAPAKISHIAAINDENSAEADHAHLARLCQAFNATPPPAGVTHLTQDLGPFRLKWERHTEFTTYTFIQEAPFERPFKDTVIGLVPQDWLAALPGRVLVATHLAVDSKDMAERPVPEIVGLFDNNTVTGGYVASRGAILWTDFRIHGDGFSRFLIRDIGMNHRAMARLVQRTLEIETYRSLAMLAFPLAREARAKIAEAESEVSKIIGRLSEIEGVNEERELLGRLSKLAAEAERISAATSYRFSATNAYHKLVRQRLKGLREERIVGLQLAGEFIDRRLAPAMDTVKNCAERQENLSNRISRASDLLRTRVDVALEGQNRDLLRSMDRRARVQLRLQATVEGLSVVAMSYYLLGMISYIAKGAQGFGAALDPFIVVTVAFPFVVAAVWFGVRRVRRSITKTERDES